MNLSQAGAITWDIAIIGAGPAGSVAAALLANRGRRVLLLEKFHWPREKVCGGCLNAAAVQALCSAGLASSLRDAQPVTHAVWHVGGKSLEMPAAGGAAVLRSDFDANLVSSAIGRGATFLPHAAARLLPAHPGEDHRLIQLQNSGITGPIRARIVLACDGIMGTSLDGEAWAKWRIARHAWMGVSMTCASLSSHLRPGAIHMHIGNGGYVGAVKLASGAAHLAAALDPAECQRSGGPGLLIEKILRANPDFTSSAINLGDIRFHGSGLLTRRRDHLGGHRVLAVGDACGYVEPFTGEGMAWAIHSAIAAADLLLSAQDWPADLPARWRKIHFDAVRRNQRWCSALRPLVHYPALARWGMIAAGAFPILPRWLSGRICPSAAGITAPGALA